MFDEDLSQTLTAQEQTIMERARVLVVKSVFAEPLRAVAFSRRSVVTTERPISTVNFSSTAPAPNLLDDEQK
jgi:hypothetical protein